MDYKKASLSVADCKFPVGKKIAYGVGEFADACVYTVFYTYFLFFLTDVAHIPPVFAGTISMVGVLWDAFTDPLSRFDIRQRAMGRRQATTVYALFNDSINHLDLASFLGIKGTPFFFEVLVHSITSIPLFQRSAHRAESTD